MLSRNQIRDIFVANGFKVKEGHDDLKDYVYKAAEALLEAQAEQTVRIADALVDVLQVADGTSFDKVMKGLEAAKEAMK